MDRHLRDEPEEFWQETLREYKKIVGSSEATSPVEDLGQIDKEGIISKTIGSVGQVAEHAATAVTPVFGQAQTVLEALKYFAGTVQFYKQNFTVDKVLQQLKEVSWNLDRIAGYIKAYEEDAPIEESLLGLITQIMAIFLRLCTIYAKVDMDSKSTSGNLKNVLRSMIRWDGGIEDCVGEIKKLTDQELNLNVAAMRVSDITANERRLKWEDSKKLRYLLKVDETGEHWLEMQNVLEQQHVPQIGEWLFDESSKFEAWVNIQQRPEDPVLWLTGAHGYGKTFLCSRVITHLKERFASEDRSRSCHVSVAWFYLQNKEGNRSSKVNAKLKDDQKTKNDKRQDIRKDTSFRDALLALVWQLAQSDRTFQKFVVEEYRKTPRTFRDPSQLWTGLIKKFCHSFPSRNSRPPKLFFLIIDGNDAFTNEGTNKPFSTMQKDANELCNKEDLNCQVRIMITRENMRPEKAAEIRLPRDSRHFDAKIFIEHHLKDLFTAWPKETDGYRTLYSLEKKLVSMFGNEESQYHVLAGLLEEFKRIGASSRSLHGLRELEKKLRVDDITNIFDSVIIPSQLERLNQELKDEEKEVFNDIISCLVCLKDWPSIQQLDAFLSLRGKKPPGTSVETQIREKYSNILTILPDNTVVADDVLRFFDYHHDCPWSVQIYEDGAYNFDQTHGHELTRLSALPTPTFNDWMDSVLRLAGQHTIARPKLQFDYFHSHIMIIKLLLSTVCSEDHEERAELRCLQAYTGMRLLWSFWRVKETGRLSSLQDQSIDILKKDIGKYLYQFFMDQRSVRIWLFQSDPQHLREHDWCIYLEDVQFWLRDKEVWGGFQEAKSGYCSDQTQTRDVVPEATAEAKIEDHFSKGMTQPILPSDRIQTQESVELLPGGPEEEHLDRAAEQTETTSALPERQDVSTRASVRSESAQPSVETDEKDQPLLSCVVKISASQWLQDFNWDAPQALLWLITVAYKAVVSPEENKAELELEKYEGFIEGANNDIQQSKALSREKIMKAEDWASDLLRIQDTHSSLYSTKDVRVAQTLVGMSAQSDHAEAEKRCEFAQHHDSSSFEATLCLSEIFEYNGNKKRALQELLKIRSYLQSYDFKEKSPTRWQGELDRFWRLCNDTNSVKEALLACKDLSDQFPLDPAEYIEKALEWMRKAKHLQDAFSVLSAIRETDGQSLLTATLHSPASSDASFHQHLHLALKDNPNLLLKGYTDAILGSTNNQTTPYLRYWYGISLFYEGRTRDALLEWEDACLEIERRTDETEVLAMLFAQTAERLASAYIGIAQGHENGKETLAKRIANLERWKDWVDYHRPYKVNYLALLLGRLFHVTDQPRKAREMVRNHLTTAFRLLEDDRADNDRKGYFGIAEALLCLDDERNARAAWSLIACVPSDEEEEEETEEVNELSITCAGGCGWEWDGSYDLNTDLYLCRDCAHVRFEDSCYKRLRNGSLEGRVCWKDHSMTKVPKMKHRDRKRIISGHVLAGKVEKVDTWLAAARRQYDILKSNQHWMELPIEFSHKAKWRMKRSFGDYFNMYKKE